ncbi:MAG: PelD GGDEF domain-containing protein [Thermocrinis sp.]|nr:PelD GGDEF domain-containing protein [Thermocrinis sp.]
MRAFRLGERITIEKVIFAEIFLLTTLLLAVGWYFNREDPFFIKSEYDLINLLVVALSLYYGYFGAIVLISFLSAGYFFFYQPFPLNTFLQNLLFALLSSEFRHIWDKKIKLALADKDKTYTEQMKEFHQRQLFSLKFDYYTSVIFVEIFLLTALFLAVGWYFNREDPFFIKSEYDLINLLVVALSLYYGYFGAIVLISFLSAGYFFFYQPFPLNTFLQNLLFALLSSEFRHIWDKKIKLALADKTYAEQMIELYRRELFSLKFEYDLLERQFVLSPYSLRNILEWFNVPSSKAFMELISDFFGVISAELYKYEDGKLISLEKWGGGVKVDKEDPLIQEALELKKSFYIPPKDILRNLMSEEVNFIALVVAESYAGKFLLAIKDMDFLYINEEVLSYITVLLEHYGDSIAFETSGFSCTKFCDREFELQAYRMQLLKERLGIDSFVVVFEYPPERREEVVKLKSMVKGLDRVCINEDKVFVLLPITPKEGVERFLERITKHMDFLEVEEIKPIGEFCNGQ